MMNDRSKAALVRSDILRILWEQEDGLRALNSSDLSDRQYEKLFFPAVRWLKKEGLIFFEGHREYVNRTGCIYEPQLTAKGEALLSYKPEGYADKFGDLLRNSFRKIAEEGTAEAIKQIPLALYTVYIAWQSSQQ